VPVINSIAFTLGGGSLTGRYMGWAVGENGLILKTVTGIPIRTLSNLKQDLLVYQWAGLGAAAAGATGIYPPGLLYPSGTALGAFPNLFALAGIVWENNNVGYIYGQAVILSTHNAGATWQVETPPAVAANGVWVAPAATVPTTY